MSEERAHGREQRDSSHLRNLDNRHSVLTAIQNAAAARKLIKETFGERPDLIIVYLGVAKKLSTRKIAAELEARDLPGGSQTSVRRSIAVLEEAGFVRKPRTGPHVVLPGWDDEFALTRELKRILNKKKVTPL